MVARASSTFQDRLAEAVAARGAPLCIGIDPDPSGLPSQLGQGIGAVRRFCMELIEATRGDAVAYKPNAAFFDRLGGEGIELLAQVVRAAGADALVVVDAKRGDIGSTAAAYAEAIYDFLGADGCTISGYLGGDSVAPFLARPDRLAFVLCRTSNPGARDLQELEVGPERTPLYLHVARMVRGWAQAPPGGTAGLVAGATWPAELGRIREEAPELPLLVPGVGAQGGDLNEAVLAASGADGRAPFLLTISRAIAGAGGGEDSFPEAAHAAAVHFRNLIRDAMGSDPPTGRG